jgi:hypothetical protein
MAAIPVEGLKDRQRQWNHSISFPNALRASHFLTTSPGIPFYVNEPSSDMRRRLELSMK